MIELEEMRQLFCRTYSGLCERFVAAADDWIGDDGEFLQVQWIREFLQVQWIRQLCSLVVGRFEQGDYEQAEALFLLMDRLLAAGDDEVQTVVATGFLEGLQHQRKIAPNLWRPLLGPLAQSHCEMMDTFHGITE